jgi:hypothetical protein
MLSRPTWFAPACVQALIVAITWVTLYVINDWLFEFVAVSEHVSWVFLPAAVRMLAVLLAGWSGVAGLFVGSLITGLYGFDGASVGQVVVLAGLSALAPMLALTLCASWLNLRSDLRGLSALQLLALSVVCGALTAGLHSLHLWGFGVVGQFSDAFLPMFVGDLVGTVTMLYVAKILLSQVGSKPQSPAS